MIDNFMMGGVRERQGHRRGAARKREKEERGQLLDRMEGEKARASALGSGEKRERKKRVEVDDGEYERRKKKMPPPTQTKPKNQQQQKTRVLPLRCVFLLSSCRATHRSHTTHGRLRKRERERKREKEGANNFLLSLSLRFFLDPTHQSACADRALSPWNGCARTIAISWRYCDLRFEVFEVFFFGF